MATKRTTTATTATTTATTTPATTTPKFRAVDALQLKTHILKMDGIHTAKSAPRKFAGFVNLSVDEIAGILSDANIDNVNHAINVFVNAKSVDAVRAAINAGTVTELTVRKK